MEIVVPDPFRRLYAEGPDRPVVKIPAPVLRKKAAPIVRLTPRHKVIAENMVRIMKEAHGVGLAAPQIGVSERIIVISPDGRPIILFNPEIIETSGKVIGEEGCLSIPGLYGDVERSATLCVRGLSRKGVEVEYDMDGLAARVVQHEVDHLDGILFTDKADVTTLHWRMPDHEVDEE